MINFQEQGTSMPYTLRSELPPSFHRAFLDLAFIFYSALPLELHNGQLIPYLKRKWPFKGSVKRVTLDPSTIQNPGTMGKQRSLFVVVVYSRLVSHGTDSSLAQQDSKSHFPPAESKIGYIITIELTWATAIYQHRDFATNFQQALVNGQDLDISNGSPSIGETNGPYLKWMQFCEEYQASDLRMAEIPPAPQLSSSVNEDLGELDLVWTGIEQEGKDNAATARKDP
ncbi:hypothetical protein C8J56DRAFT_890799 [Mycena floridula]|nr:hypothetical protein C8J56DRAFT_890799 [Mycena floridula]